MSKLLALRIDVDTYRGTGRGVPTLCNILADHGVKGMCRYPFINMKRRTINVSCELTGFRPVSIDTIIGAIERCRDEKRDRVDYFEDII